MNSGMTAGSAVNPDTAEDLKDRAEDFWRVSANVWLIFLVFPVLSVLTSDTFSGLQRFGGLAALAVFAGGYLLGFEIDTRVGTKQVLGFAVMVVSFAIGLAFVGVEMLGAAPFFTPYALFTFPWRPALLVFVTTVATALGWVLIQDEFSQYWFFPVVIVAVGAGAAMGRLGSERESDHFALQSQLAIAEERARVARDVHDVLGHSLTAIVLKSQVAERSLASVESPSAEVVEARRQVRETEQLSRKALAEIRSTVNGLRVTDVEDEIDAAREVLNDAGVALTVNGTTTLVPLEKRDVIGWTIREAVTNVIRHAKASACVIDLEAQGEVLLRVTDDGVGCGSAPEGNGLSGLRERLAANQLDLRFEEKAKLGTASKLGTALSVVAVEHV